MLLTGVDCMSCLRCTTYCPTASHTLFPLSPTATTLTGTGKTTMSSDPKRLMIGDDELGWGEAGVFNIEGGCYAKCIGLTQASKPVAAVAACTQPEGGGACCEWWQRHDLHCTALTAPHDSCCWWTPSLSSLCCRAACFACLPCLPAHVQAKEPVLWRAVRFGAVLENVSFDEDSREVDFEAARITENTRASYPVEHIGGWVLAAPLYCWAVLLSCQLGGLEGRPPQLQKWPACSSSLCHCCPCLPADPNPAYPAPPPPALDAANAQVPCVGGHPANIVFLCCDTFGLLPPVSRLSSVAQALYFFVSGFTAKVAGTEQGVGQPQPTFSACYVASSLVWHPVRGGRGRARVPACLLAVMSLRAVGSKRPAAGPCA